MRIPGLNELATMHMKELEELIFGSFERTPFQIIYSPVDKMVLSQEEVVVDDVKELFQFDMESSEFSFPYTDERENHHVEYMGYRLPPIKGFFWLIRPMVRERMFGLVDVDFEITKVSKKVNEERYEDFSKVFKETKSFFYDFDLEQYVQINKKIKKGRYKEYLEREKLYSMVLSRLEEENIKYLTGLATYSNSLQKGDPVDVLSLQKFFSDFLTFEEEVLPFLKFKFLMSHIDEDNYFRMTQYIKGIVEEIHAWMDELEQFERAGLFGSFKEVDMHEHYKFYESMLRTKRKIETLFTIYQKRTAVEKKSSSFVGFYDYDKERLYGNLSYIEYNQSFKNEPGSLENRRVKERELLETLNKGGGMEAEIETNETKKLFTPEQFEEMGKLPKNERMQYLIQHLMALKTKGVISPSDVSMYFTLYKKQV